ncbi:MAG: hypothetical protein GY696_31960 [Gammaproteobacteria bacterium]|nr:hypothetical protein [Gammaproteobacteria bacterium]
MLITDILVEGGNGRDRDPVSRSGGLLGHHRCRSRRRGTVFVDHSPQEPISPLESELERDYREVESHLMSTTEIWGSGEQELLNSACIKARTDLSNNIALLQKRQEMVATRISYYKETIRIKVLDASVLSQGSSTPHNLHYHELTQKPRFLSISETFMH